MLCVAYSGEVKLCLIVLVGQSNKAAGCEYLSVWDNSCIRESSWLTYYSPAELCVRGGFLQATQRYDMNKLVCVCVE